MLSQTLLASTLLAGNFILAIVPGVLAQSFTATFSGNIPGICKQEENNLPTTLASDRGLPPGAIAFTVGQIPANCNANGTITVLTPGSLGLQPGSLNILHSLTPATVRVRSDTPVNIAISPPNLISGNTGDPDGTYKKSLLRWDATTITSDDSNSSANLVNGSTVLEIEMWIERPQLFPAGNYIYGVTLTVTP